MNTTHSRLKRFTAAIGTAVLVSTAIVLGTVQSAAAALPSPAQILERNSSVVTADPLPTIQLDSGYIWAQTMIGTTVYAVGGFSNVRQTGAGAGSSLTARSNVLAYNITTGLLTSFAPVVNGVVKAVSASPDGSAIYIGGSFNSVNGVSRFDIAALDPITGALLPGFSPASIGGTGVYALTATNSTVYAGGLFTAANSTARTNLAAFSTSTGALLGWAPTTDQQVDAMVMDPSNAKLIIGGRFYLTNNVVQRGLAALDLSSGAILPWLAPATVKNGWGSGPTAGKAGIFALTADSGAVYGTGWVFSSATEGNLEGTFAAEAGTGAIRWVADCHGDHYGIYSTGTTVYSTSHTHACETVGLAPEQSTRTFRYADAMTTDARGILTRSAGAGATYKDWSGTPSPAPYAWYPDFTVGTWSGLGQAGLSITGEGSYISIAGEFTSVNNKQYQGLVRFSTTPSTGAKQGPRLTTATWTGGTASSVSAGTVRVRIPANWDRDDLTTSYDLYRAGVATPVSTTSVDSTWWNLPRVDLKDSGLSPGSAQSYTVVARDADGNSVTSAPISATVATGVASAYGDQVLDDSAGIYWRLGTNTTDWAANSAPVFSSGVTSTTPGAIAETNSSASNFSGTTTGLVHSTATVPVGPAFSVEAWFKTTTTSGGKIVGYGSSATGNSASYDRQIYMLNNGRLAFGVFDGTTRTLTTASSYNNGAWHHVVATLSPTAGGKLYVDGSLVVADAAAVTAQAYSGYWRVGGDALASWPNAPTSNYFAGAIDDVAIYPKALDAATVSLHNAIAKGVASPTAAFTDVATALSVSFDASTSTVPAGRTITGYAWDFGDGSIGTGQTPTHVYSASGTFQAKLTVTDSLGLSDSLTQPVAVTAANVPPVAAFTSTVTSLKASVDASTSTDDGTIVSYAWNWGDGTADGSGKIATHTYATDGTYPVTLTVTDNLGLSTPTSSPVTVAHVAPTASFTKLATGLAVSVDASGSAASDGATLTYSWDWGDLTAPGSGKTPSHTYAAAGPYTIGLTVTDSLGLSATTSANVTLSTVAFVAKDAFGRTATGGWGTADTGGNWSILYGVASAASVAGGVGRFDLPAGQTRNAALTGVSVKDSSSTVTFSLSTAPSTGSSYVGIVSRQSATADYTVRSWLVNSGQVWLVIQRGSTVISSIQIPGITRAAGDAFTMKVNVTGASPTTISAKLWRAGTAEPASWQLTSTDSTAGLQQAGYVGLHSARAGSATSTGGFTFDDYSVIDLSGAPPAPNVAPVAAFTATPTNLSVAVNGSASTDSDGSIVSYSWNWGDGTAAGTGANASHTYGAPGPYPVTLTVTDNGALTNALTKTVTVTSPLPSTFLAQDDFQRTIASGWGTSDVGGAWTVLYGAASSATVNGSQGVLSLAAGNTRQVVLQSSVAQNTSSTIVFSLNTAPSTGSAYVGLVARQHANADDNYTVRVWLKNDGTVWLVTQRGGTVVQSALVPGLTRVAGDTFNLRVDVTGVSPTTISSKIWKVGTAEPASAQLTTTDNTAVLQSAGFVGVNGNRSGSATSTGVVTFDTFRVTDLG